MDLIDSEAGVSGTTTTAAMGVVGGVVVEFLGHDDFVQCAQLPSIPEGHHARHGPIHAVEIMTHSAALDDVTTQSALMAMTPTPTREG